MKYKIFKLDKSYPFFGDFKKQCHLVEVVGVFDKDKFDTFEDAADTLKRYKLNGKRYTVLPVFE